MKILIVLIFVFLANQIKVCESQVNAQSSEIKFRNLPIKFSTSDELIRQSNENNFNFIADTSNSAGYIKGDLEKTEPDLNEKTGHNDFSKISWLDKDGLILLWNSPSLKSLADRIITGESVNLVKKTNVLRNTENGEKIQETQEKSDAEKVFFLQTLNTLKEITDWDGVTSGTGVKIQVANLPAEFRDQIIEKVQKEALRGELLSIWSDWLSEDFWTRAKIEIIQDKLADGTPVRLLTIGSKIKFANGSGGSRMSLGAIKEAQ